MIPERNRLILSLTVGFALTAISFFAGNWNELSVNRSYGWPVYWYVERGASPQFAPWSSIVIHSSSSWFSALIPINLLVDLIFYIFVAHFMLWLGSRITRAVHVHGVIKKVV
jgi:hypothetical protein